MAEKEDSCGASYGRRLGLGSCERRRGNLRCGIMELVV